MTLKELQEKMYEKFNGLFLDTTDGTINPHSIDGDSIKDFIQQAQQEAWNSAVEACIGALPEMIEEDEMVSDLQRYQDYGFNIGIEETLKKLKHLK